MTDKQLLQVREWIKESNEETLAKWEQSRETISSNFVKAIFDAIKTEIRGEIQNSLQENKELEFLRKIGSFWSVSGWLMKGVILFGAFSTAVVGVLSLISKVLHLTNK